MSLSRINSEENSESSNSNTDLSIQNSSTSSSSYPSTTTSTSSSSNIDMDLVWALRRLNSLRERLQTDQHLTIDGRIKDECQICYEQKYLDETKCCKLNVCNECMSSYIKTHLDTKNSIHIECLNTNCKKFISHYQITQRLATYDNNLLKKYLKMVSNANSLKEANCKSCPGCGHPTKLCGKNFLEKIKNQFNGKKGLIF